VPDTARLDDEWLAIEKRSPGFAGIYEDSGGRLVIAHTDPSALSTSLAAIRQVQGDIPQLHASQVVLRNVRFSFSALASYRTLVESKVPRDRLVWSDLDEVNNQVTFGVVSSTAAAEIAAAASLAGLPTGAVVAQIVKKPHLVGALNNYQDTLAGGLELGFTNGGGCSLGFLFQRWGTARYMMTAGHCTPVMGSVDTSFWAAQEYNFTRHAQEFGDPPYSALSGCPSGDTCRNSDAASFLWVDTSQTYGLGLIASPSAADTLWGGANYGPFDLYTHFNIIGEAADSWLTVGTLVSHVGQTTAFTEGRITQTCVTFYGNPATGQDLLCTEKTNMPTDSGDSGSPVMWGWPHPQTPPNTSTTYLAGIVFASDGVSTSYYSSISGIARDFGSLQTYPSKPCC
jgi:hypothetical protein